MKSLIDADVLTYSIPFGLQEGYGDEAKLAPDAMLYLAPRLDNAIENILENSGCTDYDCYLTGDGNFRSDLATLRPYKGGRAPRPILYEEARAYLLSEHPTILTTGHEADDEIGIDQDHDTVICSIDKDMDNVPGHHYRWPIIRKEEIVTKARSYYVSPEEATYNFWTQMLTGDTVDHIMGVPGIGKKRADAILSMLMDEACMARVVYNEYLRVYNESDTDPFDAFVENGMLLWICQNRDHTGCPETFVVAKGDLLDELSNL